MRKQIYATSKVNAIRAIVTLSNISNSFKIIPPQSYTEVIIYQSREKEKFYEKRIVFSARKKYNRNIIMNMEETTNGN